MVKASDTHEHSMTVIDKNRLEVVKMRRTAYDILTFEPDTVNSKPVSDLHNDKFIPNVSCDRLLNGWELSARKPPQQYMELAEKLEIYKSASDYGKSKQQSVRGRDRKTHAHEKKLIRSSESNNGSEAHGVSVSDPGFQVIDRWYSMERLPMVNRRYGPDTFNSLVSMASQRTSKVRPSSVDQQKANGDIAKNKPQTYYENDRRTDTSTNKPHEQVTQNGDTSEAEYSRISWTPRDSSSANLDDYRMPSKKERYSLVKGGFGQLESYKKLNKIGEGTYATVYKGYSRLLQKYVALKEIRMEKTEGAPCTALREISLLRDLKHANIVTLHDVIYSMSTLTLVFEYVEYDLRRYMHQQNNFLPLDTIRIFTFQMFRALEFCHSRQVLHRDLKPQNLLISSSLELKLADFGLARAKSIPTRNYSDEVATLWYRPPDVLLGDINYTGHIDIWGAGCILHEMATGCPQFRGESKNDQIYIIFKKFGIPPQPYWPGLQNNERFSSIFPYADTPEDQRSLPNSTNSGVSRDLQMVQSYIDNMTNILSKSVPRLPHSAIELLRECLHLVGSRRISAWAALRHKFFDGLLPNRLNIEDFSPEQSIPFTDSPMPDSTSSSTYKPKSKGPSSFITQKLFAASVNDVRLRPTAPEVGVYAVRRRVNGNSTITGISTQGHKGRPNLNAILHDRRKSASTQQPSRFESLPVLPPISVNHCDPDQNYCTQDDSIKKAKAKKVTFNIASSGRLAIDDIHRSSYSTKGSGQETGLHRSSSSIDIVYQEKVSPRTERAKPLSAGMKKPDQPDVSNKERRIRAYSIPSDVRVTIIRPSSADAKLLNERGCKIEYPGDPAHKTNPKDKPLLNGQSTIQIKPLKTFKIIRSSYTGSISQHGYGPLRGTQLPGRSSEIPIVRQLPIKVDDTEEHSENCNGTGDNRKELSTDRSEGDVTRCDKEDNDVNAVTIQNALDMLEGVCR